MVHSGIVDIRMNYFARFVKCKTLVLGCKYLCCFPDPKFKLQKVLYRTMSQKSILSFFKSAGQTNDKSKSKTVIEDSPVKNIKQKRKAQCIESDEESSCTPTKKLNIESESSKNREVSNDKKGKSPVEKSEKEEVIQRNGDVLGRKNGVENVEEPISSHSSSKCELNDSKHEIDADSLKNGNEDVEKPSTSYENSIDMIPKRKTARKQMNSSSNRNQFTAKQVKVESQSEIDKEKDDSLDSNEDDKEFEIKAASESKEDEKEVGKKNALESNEEQKEVENKNASELNKDDAEIENKDNLEANKKDKETENEDTNEKEEMECEVENNSVSSAKKRGRPKKDTSTNIKKTENKQKVSATKKSKDNSLKKSTKMESIQSFFTPMKNSKDIDNIEKKDEKSSSLDGEGEDSPAENMEKKIESKDISLEETIEDETCDSPVKKVQKKKVQCLESDEEGSPVKKKIKQVKVEDNSVKKTKRQVLTDDSPVKEMKKQLKTADKKGRKKKSQCLDSEDESDESPSAESSIKKECSDPKTENAADASEEKLDCVKKEQENSSSDKVTEMKISPTKVSKDSTSKGNNEKKFGVKSTSAVDTVYDPSKNNYHPVDDAFWKYKEKVPYLALAKTLELIENTSGRLKIIEILSNFFRSVMVLSPDDFLHSVYLCLNRVAPEYEGIEMGIGETLLMKAVAQATGRTVDKIKAEVAVKGDLGLVSESSRGNQRVMFTPPKLTVSAVFNKFLEIAKMSGNSAMAKKIDKIKGLFVACRDCEAKYIIRSLSGKLRIGLAEQSVLNAIARAAVLTPPGQEYPPQKIDTSKGMSPASFKELLDSQALILKTAYCECPNYDLIIPVLLKEGISALPKRCQLSPGVPLKPMLAHPTAGVDIVLARFDKNAFTCEFKYDGERAQIHMNDKGEIKIFSRNQEDNTSKYPDIISLLPEVIKDSTKSFILDSEAVAYDREKKQILPFQVLSTRKRKDAVESEITVNVCVMAFDLLYLNGESLVKKPLKERRDLLHSSFVELENKFMFAQYRDGDNAETMQEFLDESVKGNCEGLMVKALEVDASYEIAKRSHNWLKLKKDYLQGIGDTLDLIVIGGYYGKGKRTGNYGGFLLACYDNDNEEFQSICKLGTGFKDDNLEAHTKFLKEHVIKEPKSYYSYDSSLEPDDWFEPVQVWEIKCADLSISPVHRAAIGIVDPKKGISLRFPRFIRIRDDKAVEDATSSSQIADMYRNQQQIQNTTDKNVNMEEDYY